MISPKSWNAYECFRQINFAVAICWAAGKGLDLQRLATSRPSSYPGEKRASEVSFIEVAEKKNSRTFRKSKKGLKKTK